MAPGSLFPLTGALLEEPGAGSTVALFFSPVSVIHSFYLRNLPNLLPLKYNSRDIMRGFYKQDMLPMCISVLPLLPITGEPNNLSYDHEQAKQELLWSSSPRFSPCYTFLQAFPDYSLSCCLKYILKTPNFPSLSLSEVTTPELARSQNILSGLPSVME